MDSSTAAQVKRTTNAAGLSQTSHDEDLVAQKPSPPTSLFLNNNTPPTPQCNGTEVPSWNFYLLPRTTKAAIGDSGEPPEDGDCSSLTGRLSAHYILRFCHPPACRPMRTAIAHTAALPVPALGPGKGDQRAVAVGAGGDVARAEQVLNGNHDLSINGVAEDLGFLRKHVSI